MRVWLLQRSEPTPDDSGGSQRAMRTGIIAKILASQGHHVVWWTSTFDHFNHRHRYEQNTRKRIDDNYEIQYLHGCGYKKNVSLERMRENSKIAKQFCLLAPTEKLLPDIIIASIPTSELALEGINYGNQNNIPVLLDIRDLWPDVFFDLFPNFLKPVIEVVSTPMKHKLKRACKKATGIIGLTDSFVQWGVKYADRNKIDTDRVFPMGYLSSDICEAEIQKGRQFWQQKGIKRDNDELIVVFFGVMGKTNDLFPVLDALKILEARRIPVRGIICGDGEKASLLKSRVKECGNVLFPGWISAHQIKSLLEIADVGIAPYINSQNYINNIPNKPAEYLSGGLVIALSLNNGNLYELLTERQCGFTYDNKAEKLAEQLEFLAKSPNQLASMQANSRATFYDSFDGAMIYNQLITFMEQLASVK